MGSTNIAQLVVGFSASAGSVGIVASNCASYPGSDTLGSLRGPGPVEPFESVGPFPPQLPSARAVGQWTLRTLTPPSNLGEPVVSVGAGKQGMGQKV